MRCYKTRNNLVSEETCKIARILSIIILVMVNISVGIFCIIRQCTVTQYTAKLN